VSRIYRQLCILREDTILFDLQAYQLLLGASMPLWYDHMLDLSPNTLLIHNEKFFLNCLMSCCILLRVRVVVCFDKELQFHKFLLKTFIKSVFLSCLDCGNVEIKVLLLNRFKHLHFHFSNLTCFGICSHVDGCMLVV